jgi:hypothetical protein
LTDNAGFTLETCSRILLVSLSSSRPSPMRPRFCPASLARRRRNV